MHNAYELLALWLVPSWRFCLLWQQDILQHL